MILVGGEALIDLFAPSVDPTRPGAFPVEARAAGSPMNVAIGLARLGLAAAFLGPISRDAMGARIAETLRQEGVDLAWTPRPEAPTTLCLVARAEDGGPDYAIYGEGGADRQLLPADLPEDLGAVRAIHLGSYPLVTEPSATAYDRLTQREAGRRMIALDPNLRLGVAPDRALWRRRILDHAARADLLKLSDEDAEGLFPGLAPREAAERLRAAGAGLVVVTLGPEGAIAVSDAGEASAPAAASRIVDTVGAGDSVQAALIARLDALGALAPGAPRRLGPDALADLLGYAQRAAAITCSRPGADPPSGMEMQRS